MKATDFNYMGHTFKSLGSPSENDITFQDALDRSLPQNPLCLNVATGFNYEAFYRACGDDKSAVFECEGRIYVALRWGLCEYRK